MIKNTTASPWAPDGAQLLQTRLEAGGGQDDPEVPPASSLPLKVPLLPTLGLIQRPHHLGRWKDRTEPFAFLLGRGREDP